jgi:hypothetical protein
MGAIGEDIWTERCFVTITPIDGSDVEFAIRTSDMKIDTGAKDMEGLPLNNGGRATKHKPEEDSEWTFDNCYFVGIQTTGNDVSVAQLFEDWSNVDTSDPRSITSSRNKKKVRVSLMWTNDPNATSGAGAVTTEYSAYRIVACGFITSLKEDWEDKMLKANFTFKHTPFDINGSANRRRQDTEGAGLAALGAYTSSQKW